MTPRLWSFSDVVVVPSFPGQPPGGPVAATGDPQPVFSVGYCGPAHCPEFNAQVTLGGAGGSTAAAAAAAAAGGVSGKGRSKNEAVRPRILA